MKRTEQPKSLARRKFLKGAGLTGAAAGVAAATLSGTEAKATAPVSGQTSGYRESEHVMKYYELARF